MSRSSRTSSKKGPTGPSGRGKGVTGATGATGPQNLDHLSSILDGFASLDEPGARFKLPAEIIRRSKIQQLDQFSFQLEPGDYYVACMGYV